ncbi:MAG: PAS domain S-box protein [Archaeoglobaceae archaeon]
MDKGWKKIVDRALAGIYIHDRNGKVVYVNDIVEKATGYTKEEIYAMQDIYQLSYEDKEKLRKGMEKVFQGETVFYETKYVRKNGEIRWIWGYATPIELEGETYALGCWIDITKMKKTG